MFVMQICPVKIYVKCI